MDLEKLASGSLPGWVEELQRAFGGPSQAGFGTAVFFERATADSSPAGDESLDSRARQWYQFFCGPLWEKYGPDCWLGDWQAVHTRSAEDASILDELASLADPQARMSGDTMLTGHAEPEVARAALQQAFDGPAMQVLQIFRIGDGSAMSGILIAGRRHAGESAFVTFLLD
jgi:hypothetical protein